MITFERNLYTQNAVTLIPQLSYDLVTWDTETELVFLSESDNLDGTATVSYRSASPMSIKTQAFVRLMATQ